MPSLVNCFSICPRVDFIAGEKRGKKTLGLQIISRSLFLSLPSTSDEDDRLGLIFILSCAQKSVHHKVPLIGQLDLWTQYKRKNLFKVGFKALFHQFIIKSKKDPDQNFNRLIEFTDRDCSFKKNTNGF